MKAARIRHMPAWTVALRLAFRAVAFLFMFQFVPAGPRYDDPKLTLSQALTLKWRYSSDQISNFTPATDGRAVFVPLADGSMVALNVADGKLVWRAEAGGTLSADPSLDEQLVFVATQFPGVEKDTVRGTLRALSKETGITLWMRTLQAPVRGSLVAGPTALFAGGANGNVYAFDKRTGRTVWVNQYADEFDGHPTLAGNRLYIGSNGGWLLALDQSTGQLAWRYRARGPIRGSIGVSDSTVFFGSDDGYVYAFNESRTKLRWKRRTGASVQAAVVTDSGLLVSSLDNFAYLLSLNKGAILWRQLLPGRVPARPLTASDGALFTPLSTDSAIVLSLKDGKPLNTLPMGEENSSSAAPVAAKDVIVLTTPHGLLAFSATPPKP